MLRFPTFHGLLLAGVVLFAPAALAQKNILVFGDSLSAGYGIRQDAAWPSLLARRLQEKKLDYTVVNASISGETTSGGRARIDAALNRYAPQVVIVALGANDGLRGLPLTQMNGNLTAIVDAAQQSKARVLLVGQRIPPNYGSYAADFHKTFAAVAKARKTALVDFLLEGVATNARFFQADNLHPTAEAQPLLLDNVWRGLEPLLK